MSSPRGRSDSLQHGAPLPAERAAHLLRATRIDRGSERDEAIDWAHAALPESRAARRLRIERLIDEGDWASAGALLARALRDRPDDAALLRLSAESLLAQGETEGATKAAERALSRRPKHGATLLTAARSAAARGDMTAAIAMAETAGRRASGRDAARELLCELLLDAGLVARAAVVLAGIAKPNAPLRARVLAAQGRRLEAIEVLERTLREEAPDGRGRMRIELDLLDLLERAGAEARVREIVAAARPRAKNEPPLALRAAAAALALGDPEAAVAIARGLRHGPYGGRALAVIAVAAAASGREKLAERALERLRRTASLPDPAWTADLWRRAAAAEIFGDPSTPQRLQPSRPGSILEPLLRRSVEVLATESAAEGARHHIATCLAALERLRVVS